MFHPKTIVDKTTGNKRIVPLNNPLTPKEAVSLMQTAGIEQSFIYYTFSHAAKLPKFRIIAMCDEVITNPEEATKMNKTFAALVRRSSR